MKIGCSTCRLQRYNYRSTARLIRHPQFKTLNQPARHIITWAESVRDIFIQCTIKTFENSCKLFVADSNSDNLNSLLGPIGFLCKYFSNVNYRIGFANGMKQQKCKTVFGYRKSRMFFVCNRPMERRQLIWFDIDDFRRKRRAQRIQLNCTRKKNLHQKIDRPERDWMRFSVVCILAKFSFSSRVNIS